MRFRPLITLLALAVLVLSSIGLAQDTGRINPMIALHERGLPVFGVTHPAIVIGRGAGGATGPNVAAPAPLPSLRDAARETVAYRSSDFAYDNYSSASADRFLGYMGAMLAADRRASTPSFQRCRSFTPIPRLPPLASSSS